MRRERSGAAIRRLVRRIRAHVPGIALRSAFIVGFPGETEAHVDELCDFLEEAELDRVGVFRYSREEGTQAAELRGHLPETVKRRRWERVMPWPAGTTPTSGSCPSYTRSSASRRAGQPHDAP